MDDQYKGFNDYNYAYDTQVETWFLLLKAIFHNFSLLLKNNTVYLQIEIEKL